MSDSKSRRSADWPPADEPWEPQPRGGRGASRDDRTVRGGGRRGAPSYDAGAGYDDGYGDGYGDSRNAAYSGGYDDGRGSARGGSRGGTGYDDGYGSGRGGGASYEDRGARGASYSDGYGDAGARGGRGARRGAGYDERDGAGRGYDDDYDYPDERGGRRASGRPAAAAQSRGLGARIGSAFLCGAVPAAVLAFACGALSSGGSSRSIAGVTLNSKLLEYSGLAIPAGLVIIAMLLRARRIAPLGLTWGFGAVAGLSWLALLFAAQVKNVIPHLPPLATVPLISGAAFAAGAYLTDEETSATGRYACLAAVLASHVGIVAIVLTIVLA